jgi:hypothetical protein
VVDLPVNVEKAVILEILSTFLVKLRYENQNLHTREQLNTILLATSDAGHKVD